MIPASGTVVTFPSGATSSQGTVLHVADAGEGRGAIVLERTAFHPVDTAWPDQPADRGALVVRGAEVAVLGAVVGDSVEVRVDSAYRDELSAGHTGCHLAALALDTALADTWRMQTTVTRA